MRIHRKHTLLFILLVGLFGFWWAKPTEVYGGMAHLEPVSWVDANRAGGEPLDRVRASLSLRVVDEQYGKPVGNALVTLSMGKVVRTDVGGEILLEDIAIPHEAYPITITVQAPGFGAWTITNARLMADDTLIVDAQLSDKTTLIDMPAPRVLAPWAQAWESSLATTTLPSPNPLYYSTTTPPPTIRVRVTGSTACSTSAPYTVETVPFKDYVKHVLPNEWISGWHQESLRAGAMAVKTYAWHWVNRGGKWPDADVYDSTCDQVYNPAVSYARTNAAVDATWGYRMTNGGQIFHASYRAYYTQCSANSYPGCLGQYDSNTLANGGWLWPAILNYFYRDITIAPAITDGTAPEGAVVDVPANDATIQGSLDIEGWAIDYGSGMDRIEIWLDDLYQGDASYGLYRADLGAKVGYYGQMDSMAFGDGSHTLALRFYDNVGNFRDVTRSLIFANNVPPLVPSHLTPADEALIDSGNVIFTWQDNGDPDNGPAASRKFSLYVSTNSDCSSPVTGVGWEYTGTDYDQTSWATTLSDGHYFWCLYAFDGATGSGWSDARSLIVAIPTATPTDTPTATPTDTPVSYTHLTLPTSDLV